MIPKRITIHCSDTKNGERCEIEEITKWHVARGFKTVGYHMVVQPDGEVQRGRALNEQGAHVEGDNEENIGICLVGRDLFTRPQFRSLDYQLESLTTIYPIPQWAIYCHHQFKSALAQGKTCPNMDINRLLYWWLAESDDSIRPYILKT